MSNEVKLRLSVSGATEVAGGLQSVSAALKELGGKAEGAGAATQSGMGAARRGVQSISAQLQSLEGQVKSALGLGVLAAAAVALAREAFQASLALERMGRTLEFSSGSIKAYAENSAFLRTKVRELGLDLLSAGDGFAKISAAARGTALEGAGARSIFDAVSKASTVMGLSAENTSGALLAINQMISKGAVSSEELRGQLGERLPGAFQIAARAMGVTTKELGKMLEAGAIATEVFLPRFAAQMRTEMADSVAKAADSVQANMNRVSSNWTQLLAALNDSKLSNEVLKGLDTGMTAINTALKTGGESWDGWGDFVARAVGRAAEGLANVIAMIRGVAREIEGIYNVAVHALQRYAAHMRDNQYTGGKNKKAIDDQMDAERLAIQNGYDKDIAAIYSGVGKFLAATEAEIAARNKRKARLAMDPRNRSALREGDGVQAFNDAELLSTKLKVAAAESLAAAYKTLLKGYADTARAVALKVAEEAAELESGRKLTEAEKAYIKVMSDVRDGKAKLVDIEREATKGMGDSIAASLRASMTESVIAQSKAKAADDAKKAAAELAKANDAYVAGLAKSNAGLGEQIAKEAEHYIELTLGKEALDADTLGKIENAQATALMNEMLERGLDGNAAAADLYAEQARSLGELIAMKKLNAGLAAGKAAADAFLGKDIGVNIADGFDKASQSLSAFVKGFQGLVDIDAAYEKAKAKNVGNDAVLARIEAARSSQQINAYATLAGAAKGFFKEGSKGYKALDTAERAFRAYQLAVSIKTALQQVGLIGTVAAATVAGKAVETGAIVAGEAVATGATVAGEAARNTAKVPGVFMAFMSALGPWGLAAAGVAIAAVLGAAFKGGGGGGAVPTNTGTGTVLGDSSAKSESIAKAIEALADVDTMTMRYSAQMLDALRGIEANISGLATLVVRDPKLGSAAAGIQTGFNANAINDILIGKVATKLPLIGGFIAGIQAQMPQLFGKKTSITGQGITAAPQTLGSITRGQFDASYYADTLTKNKFLGITTGTSTGMQQQDASAELERQFTLIFQGFADTVKAAAGPLGVAFGTVQQRLDGFVVDIGKINFDGLTGDQITERLSAVFGAAGDNIARAVLPGVDAFQRVGEGYLQTVVRVATGVESAQIALEQLGVSVVGLGDVARKQADVGAEIVRQSIVQAETQGRMGINFGPRRETVSGIGEIISTLSGSASEIAAAYKSLVDVRTTLTEIGANGAAVSTSLLRGAGGLQGLQDSLASFSENFLSDAERLANATGRMRDQFARLGVAMPASNAEFVGLVRGIDTSTESGQRLLGQVLALSEGFAELTGTAAAAKDVAGERAGLEQALLQAQGDTVALRARELAALDPSNRALQQRIFDLQDLKVATDAAAASAQAAAQAQAAIASQRSGLEQQLLQAQGDSAALRALERAKLDDSNRALFDQIAALQDLKVATDAAATAAQAAAQVQAAIASERAGLEQQLLQAQGDSAALRALERAKLDDSNRALFDQIAALQDLKVATDAAATAAQAAAQVQAAIASERAGLEQQLLQAQGDSAALRALERAKLDDSNRALFDQIAALQDLKVATEAAAQAAQAAAAAEQAIASQRAGLEQTLLQLQGDTAELRRREIEALDPSNRALQQRIFDLQDAQAADSAAAQAAKEAADQAASLRDAWRSVGATIADEVRRILGLVGGQGQGLSSVQAQFALATAQARAGDKDAAASLPELSRTMLELATATAASAQEMALIRSSTAASLAQTLRLLEWRGADPLPAFAAGGRHAGGLRLVGERGPEIEATGPSRIWTAQQTAGMLGGGNVARLEALVEQLTAEVEGLRFEARATAGHTGKTAKILDRVTQAGDSITTTVAA